MFSFFKTKNDTNPDIDPNMDIDIFLNVGSSLDDQEDKEKFMKSLPGGVQATWSTVNAEGEVNNGGFNQYFWNSQGFEVDLALEGYRLLGANKLVEILEDAIALYIKEAPKMKQLYEENTLESFSKSYEHTELGKLDDKFYKAIEKENPSTLRLKYIELHKDDFKDFTN